MKNYDMINLLLKQIKKSKIYWIALSAVIFAFTLLDSPADKIPPLLEQFSEKYPQEKVHLHIDRDYFAAGDTIQFKAYVVNAENNHFADLSKVLYVDLITTKDSGVVALRFPLADGNTSGTIALPLNLQEGAYVLRAYTSWMRNFDEDFFYHASLKIGNTRNHPSNETINRNKQNLHEILFFPEGGDLVNGISSTVAFKATNGIGQSENVSGFITDESGKPLVNFASAFGGMGRFTLKPIAGKHYIAVVKFKNGTTNKVALPAALPSGYVLSVNNQDKANLNIHLNYSGTQSSDPVWLVTQANNKLISINEIALLNGSASLSLPKRKFATGIVQLTLFDKLSQPKAERLIFSDRRDQLRLSLGTEKAPSQGTLVSIPLEVTDQLANPVSGSFSIAVVNKSRAIDSTSTIPSILSNLLLTSDLKGYIENPDHYFRDRSPETALELDNLMLTQGWRRFVWQDVLAGKFPQINYPAEKKQTLTGQAKNSKGKPLPNIDLLLTSKGDSVFTIRTKTNNKGSFTFELPDIEGNQQLSIITSAIKTDDAINITLDQFAPSGVDQLSITALNQTLASYMATKPTPTQPLNGQTHQLTEVVVKSKKINLVEKAVAPSANLNGAGKANQIVTYKELAHCATLENCLIGRLVGVFFKTVKDPASHSYIKIPYSTSGFNKPMLFVLDGVPMQPGQFSLSSIPIGDVQTIEVLRSGGLIAAYGLQGSGGVLVITTKKGGIDYNTPDEPEDKPLTSPPGVFSFVYNGYQKQREFYVPKYTPTNKTITSPETIFWNPAVQTNDEGKAVIQFPVGSNIKKFAVIIEGISAEGKIGYKYQEFVNN
jgi:hypothetical protein